MAQYQDMRKMSLNFNSAFDDSGYCECARQFKYKTESVCDLFNYPDFKIVGSRAEGTHCWDSDVDFLIIDQNGVKVGYNTQESVTESVPYLRLTRGPLTPAGYTKFQIYFKGYNCKNIENTLLQRFFTYEIKKYNSNTTFLTNRIVKDKFQLFNMSEHGPAQTTQMSDVEASDKILAYESKILPINMKSWFERTRLYGWPSKTTCALFKSMGCCYVGVGHSKSHEQEFEWRISPTRQELYLMFNLNQTQFRCYILLKLIKKTIITKHCGNGISSYHCKTALFWTIENTENNIWQPHNLIECVLKCLNRLLVWVTEKKCPNYFIPEENMFETKEINTIHMETLQKVINYFPICGHLWLPVIIKNYKKMNAIIESTIMLKKGLSESNNGASLITEHELHKFQQYINLIKTKPRNACIKEFQKLVSPQKIDIDIFLEMLEEKVCCFNRRFHLKSLIESNTFTEKDITALINDPSTNSHMDHEYCLKLASIAATQGEYSTCDVLLQNLYQIPRFNIYCMCHISFQRDETNQQRRDDLNILVLANISEDIRSTGQFIDQLSINDILQRFLFCLQFRDSANEVVIVMSPCHFEAHKTVGIPLEMLTAKFEHIIENVVDPISIHPMVYMHFLQYKNSDMMNKKDDMCVALENIEHIMHLVSSQKVINPHPDTTLNLLGHIYTTKGWYRLAAQCFRRSWQIQPYYNAVKWHVMFMLF